MADQKQSGTAICNRPCYDRGVFCYHSGGSLWRCAPEGVCEAEWYRVDLRPCDMQGRYFCI